MARNHFWGLSEDACEIIDYVEPKLPEIPDGKCCYFRVDDLPVPVSPKVARELGAYFANHEKWRFFLYESIPYVGEVIIIGN